MKRIELVAMTMARSGTYAQQYRRPFQTDGQGRVIQAFQERFDQVGNTPGAASGQLFAGIAGSFLRPQANPESEILIPNSWNTERYYFVLEVLVYNPLGGQTREVIQGYTSYTDTSYGGNFDPNMQFFINSITRIKAINVPGRHGMMQNKSVSESFHILANNDYTGPQSVFAANPYNSLTMRPQDVVGAIQMAPIENDASGYSDIVDLRTANSSVAKASSRNNVLASEYTGRMVGSWAMATNNSMMGTQQEIVGKTLGMLADNQGLTADEFCRAISGLNGTTTTQNWFTYKDLMKVDQSLDQRCHVINAAPTIRMNNGMQADITTNNFNDWGGSNQETVVATIFSSALPSLMVEAGLRHLELQATNHSGRPYVIIPYAAPIVEGMPFTQLTLQMLEHRILSEILDDISMQNQIAYQITASVRLTEASQITIQLESNPMSVFVMPTFADALTAPVVTGARDRVSEVAHDFSNLFESLVQTRHPSLDEIVSSTLPGVSAGGFANI